MKMYVNFHEIIKGNISQYLIHKHTYSYLHFVQTQFTKKIYFIAKNVQSELVFLAFNLNKVEHKGDILQ